MGSLTFFKIRNTQHSEFILAGRTGFAKLESNCSVGVPGDQW